MQGIVFNIQKFSIHDGPGIRTLIFLKGCSLACKWCSNPEGINSHVQMAYNREHCIGIQECGLCQKVCPDNVIREEKGTLITDFSACNTCKKCVEVCPSHARILFGNVMTPEQVVEKAQEDSLFYTHSGGGLTLSGGEPLLQADFSLEILRLAKKKGIHTAIETTGNVAWGNLEKVIKYVDFIHYDIKHKDTHKHKEYTNVANEKILENFTKLIKVFPNSEIMVRTPVIPNFNDSEQALGEIIEFLHSLSFTGQYELLAYHDYGSGKYAHLGLEYPLKGTEGLSKELFRKLKTYTTKSFNFNK